jgi:hypothetical protein
MGGAITTATWRCAPLTLLALCLEYLIAPFVFAAASSSYSDAPQGRSISMAYIWPDIEVYRLAEKMELQSGAAKVVAFTARLVGPNEMIQSVLRVVSS